MPGTKKRVALFDEDGQRIRGENHKEAAELALARERLSWCDEPDGPASGGGEWLVARACSDYIQYCERGVKSGAVSKGHRDNAVRFLNDLCKSCGALPVARLKKRHITTWIEGHETWQSSATHRSVISFVQAALNRAEEMYGIANPLKGLKKPAYQPRLDSFSEEDEKAIYAATEECFQNFLFAGIHTGLRPFCELARITADDVEEAERGMMWRVYSSKTKKTRKIPVRPEVAALARKMMKTAPKGSGMPLFRNTKGKPWKPGTGVARFLSIKTKLGWDRDPVRKRFSCYTARHTFAHRMLSGYWNEGIGCTIETLAELIGDTPKVAFDHYGREWGQHYQDPLWAAIGDGPRPGSKKKRPGTSGRKMPKPARRKGTGRKPGKQRRNGQ
jgi:integrase